LAGADTVQMTVSQAVIEENFIDDLTSQGIHVERPVIPISFEVQEAISDVVGYPVKVDLCYY
jgi:hypothetical protein